MDNEFGIDIGAGTPAEFLTDADLPLAVYNSFRDNGLSRSGAIAAAAEVGRENNFQSKYLFGIHSDPANNATNLGMYSWQGSRGTALRSDLERQGLIDGNRILPTKASIDAMTKFAIQEMSSPSYGNGSILNTLKGDVDPQTAGALLGRNYIKWAYDNPKYASGHRNRDSWYSKIDSMVGGRLPALQATQAPSSTGSMDSASDIEQTVKQYEGKPAKREVGFMDQFSAYFDQAQLQTGAGVESVTKQIMQDTMDKIARESGVAPDEPKQNAGALLMRAAELDKSIGTLQQEDKVAAFDAYLAKVKQENPDYKLPVQSSAEIDSLAAKDLVAQRNEAATTIADSGYASAPLNWFAGSTLGYLSDPKNLVSTVMAGLVPSSLMGSLAAKVGVSAASNAGIEAANQANLREKEADIGIDRSLADSAEQVGLAGLLGGAVPLVGHFVSPAFKRATDAVSDRIGSIAKSVYEGVTGKPWAGATADATASSIHKAIVEEAVGIPPEANPLGSTMEDIADMARLSQEASKALENGEAPIVVPHDTPRVVTPEIKTIITENNKFIEDLAHTPEEKRVVAKVLNKVNDGLDRGVAPEEYRTKLSGVSPETVAEARANTPPDPVQFKDATDVINYVNRSKIKASSPAPKPEAITNDAVYKLDDLNKQKSTESSAVNAQNILSEARTNLDKAIVPEEHTVKLNELTTSLKNEAKAHADNLKLLTKSQNEYEKAIAAKKPNQERIDSLKESIATHSEAVKVTEATTAAARDEYQSLITKLNDDIQSTSNGIDSVIASTEARIAESQAQAQPIIDTITTKTADAEFFNNELTKTPQDNLFRREYLMSQVKEVEAGKAAAQKSLDNVRADIDAHIKAKEKLQSVRETLNSDVPKQAAEVIKNTPEKVDDKFLKDITSYRDKLVKQLDELDAKAKDVTLDNNIKFTDEAGVEVTQSIDDFRADITAKKRALNVLSGCISEA